MISVGQLSVSLDILTTSGRHPECQTLLTLEIAKNIEELSRSINLLFGSFGDRRRVTSGLRSPEFNAALIAAGKKAAKHSLHLRGAAADLEDDDGKLAAWCNANLDLLEHFNLWMEDTRYTREKRDNGTWAQWVHLQRFPPKSGKRVFIPYKGPPPS